MLLSICTSVLRHFEDNMYIVPALKLIIVNMLFCKLIAGMHGFMCSDIHCMYIDHHSLAGLFICIHNHDVCVMHAVLLGEIN